MSKLTKYEKETIVLFNEADERLISRLTMPDFGNALKRSARSTPTSAVWI